MTHSATYLRAPLPPRARARAITAEPAGSQAAEETNHCVSQVAALIQLNATAAREHISERPLFSRPLAASSFFQIEAARLLRASQPVSQLASQSVS